MKITATKRHIKLKKWLCVVLLVLVSLPAAFSQDRPESHSTRVRPTMSPEAKALVEDAIGVVCTQAKLDPKSSVAIDEMQARPSLPVHSPEARSGAERAQRLLPLAKTLVITALRQLSQEYASKNLLASRSASTRRLRALTQSNASAPTWNRATTPPCI